MTDRGGHYTLRGLSAALATSLLLLGAASAPSTLPADQQKIAEAIAQLGDPNFQTREQASKFLWSIGLAAEPALTEAAKDSDPEVAARAREILADFAAGIRPDSPPQLIELARGYRRTASAAERRLIVDGLFGLGVKAYPTLARLGESETDAPLKDLILKRLGAQAAAAVQSLIAANNLPGAEQLLELALADSSDSTARTYAIYHTLRGQADAKIAALQKRIDAAPSPAGVYKALAYLYRAKGNLAAALPPAEKTDPELFECLLVELGDWKRLAAQLRQRFGDEADLEHLGFLAAYQRLAGDQAAFEHSLTLIRRYVQGAANQHQSAKILLLNDRPDEAIASYSNSPDILSAFELLCAQQKYKQAIELAEKKWNPQAADNPALPCNLARTLQYLGRSKEALAILDKLPIDSPGYALIVAERQCGFDDRVLEHAMVAIDQAGGTLQSLFTAAFGASGDAVRWWNYYRSRYPDDKPRDTLRRMHDLLSGRLSARQLAALSEDASKFALQMSNRDRPSFLALLYRTMAATGQEKLSEQTLHDAIKSGGDIELGVLAASRTQWTLAEQLLAGVLQREPDNPTALCLRGWTMIRSGQKNQGRALIDRANLLLLADGRQRLTLAEILQRAGLHEAAQEQSELLSRTAAFGSTELIDSRARIAADAAKSGDYLAAAECFERSMLGCLQSGTEFLNERNYVTVPHLMHKTRAIGLLRSGKIDEALAQVKICESIIPGDTDLAIALVPLLEKTGHKKEADELFSRTLAIHERLCTDFPDSPALHNSLAWLLCRCRRNLDQAIAHAQKGIELAPKNTAIIDTLAEAYFQKGDREEAIDVIKRCIELEPASARHKAALKRLQDSSPDSDPIE